MVSIELVCDKDNEQRDITGIVSGNSPNHCITLKGRKRTISNTRFAYESSNQGTSNFTFTVTRTATIQ